VEFCEKQLAVPLLLVRNVGIVFGFNPHLILGAGFLFLHCASFFIIFLAALEILW
jgi:hypothetical protein